MRKAIGIDIGTTTISAVVIDTKDLEIIESRTIPNNSFIDTGNSWERIQDTAVIIEKSQGVLNELLSRYQEVYSIGLTGQMHGILLVDEEGGCVSPLYTWQDERGNLSESDGRSLVEKLNDRYGVNAATGYGMVTCIYQSQKGLMPEQATSVCTIADYLGMVLTGRKKPLLHVSNAASLSFFDVKQKRFMEKELACEGVNTAWIPECTDRFEILGEYRGIPVTTAIGDNQASFLGAVGMKENIPLVNVGTGGQLSILSNVMFTAPGIETRPFTGGKYLLAGSALCSGRAYAILEKFFRSYAQASGAGDQEQYELMGRLAQQALEQRRPAEEHICVSTRFQGTRFNPEERGSITGISEDNFTPENLVYGVLEGIARELYDSYTQISEGTGIKAEHLVVSGNGVRKNPVLQKIFGELFQTELTISTVREEAACGAAISSIREEK